MNKSKLYDYIGLTFNNFTVIDVIQGKWSLELLCVCRCGNLRAYKSASFKTGHIKSCGCVRRNRTHGKSNTSEYNSWKKLKDRCLNPNNRGYYLYGGRGIKFCKRWVKFELFFKDMGYKPSPKHTLDRFPNNNGDYKPSNCRWATPKQQSNNLRRTIRLTIDKKTHTISEWAEISHLSAVLIRDRVWRGWSARDAVFKPHRSKSKQKT